MPFAFGIIFFVLFVVGFVFLIRYSATQQRKQFDERTQQFQELARALGISYISTVPQTDSIWKYEDVAQGVDFMKSFADIEQIRNRGGRIRFAMEGIYQNRQVRLMEHTYVVSTGKSSTTYYRGIVAVAVEDKTLNFSVRREGFLDSVKEWFGYKDFQIGDDEFDKRFHLATENQFIFEKILDIDVRERLIRSPAAYWVVRSGRIIAIVEHIPTPETLRAILDDACQIAYRISLHHPGEQF